MAMQKALPATVQANLSIDQMRKGVLRLERSTAEIERFDVTQLTKRGSPEQKALEATIEGVLTSVFGHDTVEFRRYARSTKLDHGSVRIRLDGRSHDDCHEARQYVAEGKAAAVQILQSAIKWLNDEIEHAAEFAPIAEPAHTVALNSKKIFIVHGHDEGARQTVARFIEKIGFEAVILSEQASQGRTIIEKIEAHTDVGFAIILLTEDDVGGKTAESLCPRARQNVCSGQVTSDSLIDLFDVDSRSKALGDRLPSFECSLILL